MNRRSFRILLAVGVLVGALFGTAIAATYYDTMNPDVDVDGTIPVGHSDGVDLYVHTSNDQMDLSNFTTTDRLYASTSAGNISFYSNGFTEAHVYPGINASGTWTNVTQITAGGTWIEVYPIDKPQFDVRGDTNAVSIRDTIALDDGVVDFYISGTDSGLGSVVVRGLPANTEIGAIDADTKAFLDSATSDSNGNVTLDIPLSDHNVLLTDASDSKAPVVENADPTGNIIEPPDTLSFDLSDADFPSDSVDVTVDFEGTQIYTESDITQNTTVSTSNFNANELGKTYSWNVEATDGYGETTTESYSFTIPDTITIRNETQPDTKVTGANTEFTFYSVDGTTVVTRNDTDNDGEVSLSGLPDTQFVVTIDAENFYDRRVYIESIFEQQDVFALNSTAYPDAVFTEFQLDDRTGDFPPSESVLEVQRALNTTSGNESQWYTIGGDFFGSTNRYPFTGEYQSRYRLVITNGNGDRRVLGTYIPTVGGVQTIPIGRVSFSADDIDDGVAFTASLNDQETGQFLTLQFADLENATSELNYTIYDAENGDSVLSDTVDVDGQTLIVYNMTKQDPSITEDQGYRIEWAATREIKDRSGTVFAGAVQQFIIPVPGGSLNLLMWVFLVAVAGITALFDPKLSMVSTPVLAFAMTLVGVITIPTLLVSIAFIEGALFYFGESQTVR